MENSEEAIKIIRHYMETWPKYLILKHIISQTVLQFFLFLDSGYRDDEHPRSEAMLFRAWILTNLRPPFSNLKMEAAGFLLCIVTCQTK